MTSFALGTKVKLVSRPAALPDHVSDSHPPQPHLLPVPPATWASCSPKHAAAFVHFQAVTPLGPSPPFQLCNCSSFFISGHHFLSNARPCPHPKASLGGSSTCPSSALSRSFGLLHLRSHLTPLQHPHCIPLLHVRSNTKVDNVMKSDFSVGPSLTVMVVNRIGYCRKWNQAKYEDFFDKPLLIKR